MASQPCLQAQPLATPSRTLHGKLSPEGKGIDMQDPTCFSVPLFASSHAWLSALFFLLCQKLLECKEQGVPWSWEGGGGGSHPPPLAEHCQQVAFCLRALPPPAVFSAAPTEIWPLCHFLGSRPPQRTSNAAGKEGLAGKRPYPSPKTA